MGAAIEQKKRNGIMRNARLRKKLIFYVSVLALPVIQFCVFYIYVNFNSFVMAFQRYSEIEDQLGYRIEFASFDNFKKAFETIAENVRMIGNSMILFGFQFCLGITLALLFSYYIYKKYFGHRFFKVVLFLPQMVSGVVFGLLFQLLCNDVYRMLTGEAMGLLSELRPASEVRPVLIVYCLWMSFGVNVLLFSGSMSGIDQAIVEAAEVDGVNNVQEFWYITLPMIFPTLTTFVILGIAGIFTDQMHLYTFYGIDALPELRTTGFFLYAQVAESSFVPKRKGVLSYSVLSAYGLIITAILFPLTMVVRKLMAKFGPSVD